MTRKITGFVLALFILPLSTMAQNAMDYLNIGKTITFNGTDYKLGWSANPKENYYIQEFYPDGENGESYHNMYTVSTHIIDDLNPEMAVKAKAAELDKRKETDMCCNYEIMENNGDYIMNFLVSANSEVNPDKLEVIEFDVHYYHQVNINGRKALQLDFYSHREYGDDIIPFLNKLKTDKDKYTIEISKMKVKCKLK